MPAMTSAVQIVCALCLMIPASYGENVIRDEAVPLAPRVVVSLP